MTFIGYDYRSFGNTPKSVEYYLKATTIAQETGNEKLIGITKLNLAHIYKDRADYPKALNLYLSANESANKVKDIKLQIWAYLNLGQVYSEMNKLDSALIYAQRDYELCMQFHEYHSLSVTY